MLQVGDVVGGRLRVDRVIGVGGMGVVVAARHLELRHTVAIKMLKPEMATDTEIVERFLREARAVAQLRTEHVCRVFDVARTEDGTPYIVMELLQGSDVASMIRAKPLPIATAIDFVMQACVALAEAHANGIVHRDLKPPNLFVMRRPDGGPLIKVLDFGIAKAADELRLTHSMTMLGSPQYMSPEQLTTPRDVDARTDIWSLGVTIYQLITRRLAFPSAQIGELAVMITSQAPELDLAPPDIRAVIARCLEKDRDARYRDVGDLAEALVPFGGPSARAYAALVRSPAAPQVRTSPGVGAPGNAPAMPARAAMPVQNVPTVATVATMATGATVATMATGAPANPATRTSGASRASIDAPMAGGAPAANAAPAGRGKLLWIPAGVLLVAAGVIGGYLARGSASDSRTNDARASDARARTAESNAAGSSVATGSAAGSNIAGSNVTTAAGSNLGSGASESAAGSNVATAAPATPPDAGTVARDRTPRARGYVDPAMLSSYEQGLADVEKAIANGATTLYYSATTMSCVVKRTIKAKHYFSLITKDEEKRDAIRDCALHGIDLER